MSKNFKGYMGDQIGKLGPVQSSYVLTLCTKQRQP